MLAGVNPDAVGLPAVEPIVARVGPKKAVKVKPQVDKELKYTIYKDRHCFNFEGG